MKKWIRSLIGSSLFKNISSLGIIRVSQFIIPFITVPYLARVIGVEGIGKLAFAQAVAAYFALVPELGINLYAPREIAINIKNRSKVEILLNNIFIIRLTGSMLVAVLFIVAVYFIKKFNEEKILFLFSSIAIVNSNLMLAWFFQGIEKMWNTAIANILGATLGMIGVFIFIHQPEQYIFVPLINGITGFIPVCYTIYSVKQNGYGFLKFSLIKKIEIKKVLTEAFPLYISSISISIYTGIYTIILGFITDIRVVGIYSAAEKLIKAGLSIMGIMSQAFYPHISKAYSLGKDKMLKELRKTSLIIAGFSLAATVFTFVFADFFINIIYGSKFSSSVIPLRIMSFLFILVGTSNIAGFQILLPLGKRKVLLYCVIFSSVASITSLLVLAPILKENGAAIAYLISEFFSTAFQVVYIVINYKNDIRRILFGNCN